MNLHGLKPVFSSLDDPDASVGVIVTHFRHDNVVTRSCHVFWRTLPRRDVGGIFAFRLK